MSFFGLRYELHEVLGRGGTSVVYRATDQVLDRTVAVKVLPAAYLVEHERVEHESEQQLVDDVEHEYPTAPVFYACVVDGLRR